MRDRTGAPQGRLLHMAVIVAHQSQVGRLRENALSLWTPPRLSPLTIPLQLASCSCTTRNSGKPPLSIFALNSRDLRHTRAWCIRQSGSCANQAS